jgi:hypothetical protein
MVIKKRQAIDQNLVGSSHSFMISSIKRLYKNDSGPALILLRCQAFACGRIICGIFCLAQNFPATELVSRLE